MENELGKNYYCSSGYCSHLDKDYQSKSKKVPLHCMGCKNKHRKYPMPSEYKEEYGNEYPDDGAVYGYNNGICAWMIYDYFDAKRYSNIEPIVCACTPFGKPERDWKPLEP
jgi:hypothetical protein